MCIDTHIERTRRCIPLQLRDMTHEPRAIRRAVLLSCRSTQRTTGRVDHRKGASKAKEPRGMQSESPPLTLFQPHKARGSRTAYSAFRTARNAPRAQAPSMHVHVDAVSGTHAHARDRQSGLTRRSASAQRGRIARSMRLKHFRAASSSSGPCGVSANVPMRVPTCIRVSESRSQPCRRKSAII